jgi:hypothetical protein
MFKSEVIKIKRIEKTIENPKILSDKDINVLNPNYKNGSPNIYWDFICSTILRDSSFIHIFNEQDNYIDDNFKISVSNLKLSEFICNYSDTLSTIYNKFYINYVYLTEDGSEWHFVCDIQSDIEVESGVKFIKKISVKNEDLLRFINKYFYTILNIKEDDNIIEPSKIDYNCEDDYAFIDEEEDKEVKITDTFWFIDSVEKGESNSWNIRGLSNSANSDYLMINLSNKKFVDIINKGLLSINEENEVSNPIVKYVCKIHNITESFDNSIKFWNFECTLGGFDLNISNLITDSIVMEERTDVISIEEDILLAEFNERFMDFHCIFPPHKQIYSFLLLSSSESKSRKWAILLDNPRFVNYTQINPLVDDTITRLVTVDENELIMILNSYISLDDK